MDKCCENPHLYYANLINHYRCTNCGDMFHKLPSWAIEVQEGVNTYYVLQPTAQETVCDE